MPELSEKDEERGNRMGMILRDPLVVETFQTVETQFIDQWRKGKTPVEREQAHARLMALEEIQTAMRKIVDNGEVAKLMRKRMR